MPVYLAPLEMHEESPRLPLKMHAARPVDGNLELATALSKGFFEKSNVILEPESGVRGDIIKTAKMLRGEDAAAHTRTLAQLLETCKEPIPYGDLASEGAFADLIHLLAADDSAGWRPAARCLLLTLQEEDGRAAFQNVNAVGMLMGMLETQREDSAIERVMRVLLALVADTSGSGISGLSDGALATLISTLKGGRGKSNCSLAVQLLTCAAASSESNRDKILAAGAVEPMVALLGAGIVLHDSGIMDATAAGLLAAGAGGRQDAVGAIRAAGGVPLLAKLLRLPAGDSAAISAAEVLRLVARGGAEGQAEVVAAGAIPPLLAMLRADPRTGLVNSIDSIQVASGLLAHLGCSKELKEAMDSNNASLLLQDLAAEHHAAEPAIADSLRTVLRNLEVPLPIEAGDENASPGNGLAATPTRAPGPVCGAGWTTPGARLESGWQEVAGKGTPPSEAGRATRFRARLGDMLSSVKDSLSRSIASGEKSPPPKGAATEGRKAHAGSTPKPAGGAGFGRESAEGEGGGAETETEEDFKAALAQAMAASVEEQAGGEMGDDIRKALELSKQETDGGDVAREIEEAKRLSLAEASASSRVLYVKGEEGGALSPPGPLDAANLIFGGALGLSPVNVGSVC